MTAADGSPAVSQRPAQVLLLGGGVFLGRHLAAACIAAGHDVTAFHRGVSSAELPADVQVVHGDRGSRADLAALTGTRWDVVMDTCGYLPAHVRLSAELLGYDRYVFISSISVYRSFTESNSEDAAVLPAAYVDQVSAASYGAAKVGCERMLARHASAPCLIVRCGLMTGPLDVSSAGRYRSTLGPTDLAYDSFAGRLPYWPWRFRRPGEVLAPGDPQAAVQVLDARDLASWLAAGSADQPGGTVNAVGAATTIGDWIAACQLAARPAGPPPRWIPDSTLLAAGLRPGLDLPLWNPASAGIPAFFAVDGAAARQRGLRTRPAEQTARDLLRWIDDPHLTDSDVVGYHPLDIRREKDALSPAGRLPYVGSGP